MTEISGTVASGFEELADAFLDAARSSHGHGTSLHVRIDGAVVADLWNSGSAEEPWGPDTPSVIFSCTKGIVSILIGELLRAGSLHLDAPVVDYWPEFGANGKSAVTVRELLSHRGGLPTIRRSVSKDEMVDWNFMVDVMASEKPFWLTGDGHQYHAMTFGWLAGELIRRATGVSVGHFLQRVCSIPLGVTAWIGVPESAVDEVARLHMAGEYGPVEPIASVEDDELAHFAAQGMTLGRGIPTRFADPGRGFNDKAVLRAELPGAGGVSTARSVATIWSATVSEREKVRLLNDDVIDDMCLAQSEGAPILGGESPFPRWGSGFMLNSERRPFLSDSSFGHDGLGGQVAFADRAQRVGFAFISTDLQDGNDRRGIDLVHALRRILA